MRLIACPLCRQPVQPFRIVDEVQYHECTACDFIFADPELLARADRGEVFREYDDDYWHNELESARQRSFGSSLARAAEAILYCRIPIRRFVDIGTGPGYLLDALSAYLPSHSAVFHGVEKFPPPPQFRTCHPNYNQQDLADSELRFQCGTCVEVLEHLTPTMADGLARAMARVSEPGSLYLLNTGLTDFVKSEDPGYLDPYRRGHITCWSTAAATKIFGPHGFQVHPLRGKTWAFVVEFRPLQDMGEQVESRIWTAPQHNADLLRDPVMGEVMYILGRESARAY